MDEEIEYLREMLVTDDKRFDVILSNPPFSMKYSRDSQEQQTVMNQYDIGGIAARSKSLLSSVMFLERYRELVAEDGRILAVIDDSILSGESYALTRDFIRSVFIIAGIISLPGDAFRRADARVKTSILILRPKNADDEQGDVFMERAAYLGLSIKSAKRIGIGRAELEREAPREAERILSSFAKFLRGESGPYVVRPAQIGGRLDVKHCIGERGRRKKYWASKGLEIVRLDSVLTEETGREVAVDDDAEYGLLKVAYGGEVLESEKKRGEECSYKTLYRVEPWDIVVSNINLTRGAVGIVPMYLNGSFVSNEYTILRAETRLDAFYYSQILRTKEILADILSGTTGMGRGRIRWQDMCQLEIPRRNSKDSSLKDAVNSLESQWDAIAELSKRSKAYVQTMSSTLRLDGPDSRLRWLSDKPPE